MSDIKDAKLAGWCGRCRCIVFVCATEAERDRLADMHDRWAHPVAEPPQTQWARDLVRA